MTLLFISDLHLSKERPAITRAFFRFMDEHAANADALYILGDLFEAWIGDDDPDEPARAVVAALRRLSDKGVRVYFLHGNRDFLVGRRFARETGCTLLGDYHLINPCGQNILLCHGDTLCTADHSYQRFRRQVRNPLYRWLLAHLPLKKRQAIATDWRARSRAANSNKAANIMDVTPEAVEQQLEKYDAALLIHGHTHRPGVHHHRNGDRVVLGDWDKLGWYVRIEGDVVDLVDFPIDSEAEDETADGNQDDTGNAPTATPASGAPAAIAECGAAQVDGASIPPEPAPPPESTASHDSDDEKPRAPTLADKKPSSADGNQLSLDI